MRTRVPQRDKRFKKSDFHIGYCINDTCEILYKHHHTVVEEMEKKQQKTKNNEP